MTKNSKAYWPTNWATSTTATSWIWPSCAFGGEPMPQIPRIAKVPGPSHDAWTVVTLCRAHMGHQCGQAGRRGRRRPSAGVSHLERLQKPTSNKRQTAGFRGRQRLAKKKDGSIITIPVQRLSTADRDYAAKLGRAAATGCRCSPAPGAVASHGPPSRSTEAR